MTDHTARISSIKSALEKEQSKMPLRRHRDDKYVDRIEVMAGNISLLAIIVPRYKTSDLSGDEWRISAHLTVAQDRHTPVLERRFNHMNSLTEHAPIFLWRDCRTLLGVPDATLVALRKGVVLTERKFSTFGEAALGMGWHILTANEGEPGIKWHHLSDKEERARCQQVGCSEPPVNTFHLKKILYGNHPPDTFMVAKYDFEGQFVWYCARHTTRGDCGFEDADKNLELVEGDGRAQINADDESPSVFGGAVQVTLPK